MKSLILPNCFKFLVHLTLGNANQFEKETITISLPIFSVLIELKIMNNIFPFTVAGQKFYLL